MKRIRLYSLVVFVVMLSQLCGPSLIPWRPGSADGLLLLLAWLGAVVFVAYAARNRELPVAIMASLTQIILIRYRYAMRQSFGFESDSDLLIKELFVICGYVLITCVLGVLIARRWPPRASTAR